ncbi:SPOSA6832_04096, partial [Sporobolomyces salmonicolor]
MSTPQPPSGPPAPSNPDANYRAILEYLTKRGHHKAALSLQADLEQASNPSSRAASPAPNPAAGGGKSVPLDDFAERNAPSAPRAASQGPAAAGQQPQRRRPDQSVAPGQMLADPPSWEKGYEGLRAFVENSLDIHRPELHPLLLPLFVHSYLDLVLSGYREAADHFLNRFSPDHAAQYPSLLRLLSSLRLREHVSENEQALRWRQERYHVRLSERGWGLLLGWLQGGGLAGSVEGTEGRGRDRVLAIINERVKLEREVQRRLKDADADIAPPASSIAASAPSAGDVAPTELNPAGQLNPDLPPLVAPFPADLPPYPSTLRTIDVQREVELVRETRKRIRLGAEAYYPPSEGVNGAVVNGGGALLNGGEGKEEKKGEKKVGKPSVCLFTVHDAGDSLSTVSFSDDSSIMAAGFGESYIRLWSLTGKGLKALRTDLKGDEVGKIHDANDLKNLYHPAPPQTRKLIAHSGPVYSLSFDPVPGPSSAPRYLLSSSADCTIRLWSLETYTNLVVYRGHREPVWDVEWGPRGVYFASASRDRTARVWITDRVNAVRIFAGHLSDVNCVTFHPNSLYIATGSSDRTCRLWDVQKGMCVRVFVGHRGAVMRVKISPDGRWLASAGHVTDSARKFQPGDDHLIHLWNLSTGALQKTFSGHSAPIHSLSFSVESTVLLSGSSDETVRVWDVLSPPSSADSGAGEAGGVGDKRRLGAAPGGGIGKKDGKDGGAGGDGKGAGGSSGPCPDLLATLATKRTPVLEVKFTPRNLALAAGAMRDL